MQKYKLPISKEHYSKLSKDSFIGQFFGVEHIGFCQKLFSDYSHNKIDISQKGWENYYNKHFGFSKLIKVFEIIKEKCYTFGMSDEDVKWYIFYRSIGQTWNGLITEQEVIDELMPYFPEYNFRKTSYQIDHTYCIDWEMMSNDKAVLGLQIKPISYKYMNTPYQLKAKENHKKLNDKYKRIYAPYIYVFYDESGIYQKNKLIEKIDIKKIY